MQYWKTVDENSIVESVNSVNADGYGNISVEEYDKVKSLFKNMPIGKCLYDNNDGTYAYIDKEPEPEPEIDDTEAMSILLGGAS